MPSDQMSSDRLSRGLQGLLAGLDLGAAQFVDDQARARLERGLSAPAPGDSKAGTSALETGWTIVKHNVSRTVYRRAGAGGVLYLKHFHSRSLWHRLQRRLRASDALCEMRFSRYLAEASVPVPVVLAACCRNGWEWLISEGIEPAEPLDKWHARQRAGGQHAAVRQATIALAELVGRMHASGVIHRDLHCGNVLVRLGKPDAGAPRPELVLMDMHRMRGSPKPKYGLWEGSPNALPGVRGPRPRRRRLSRRSRAANLAQLLADRVLWTTRSQRLRFLKHYLRAGGSEGTLRGWVRLIEPAADRHRARLNAQRERRILSANRYFAGLRAGQYRGHVVLASKRQVPGSRAGLLEFTVEDWQAALGDVEGLFSGPDVQVVKDSRSSLVVRRKLRVGGAELDVHVKRARRKRLVRLLLDLFRPSRPLRAFKLGHELLARHIQTALPLAALENRRGRFLADSVLITETVASAIHLNKFLNRYLSPAGEGGLQGRYNALGPAGDQLGRPGRSRLAQQVLWQMGRLLRRLHQEGYAHRDLKATNLLVHWEAEPKAGSSALGNVSNGGLPGSETSTSTPDPPARWPEIVLVDLDGLKPVRRVSRRQEFRGLMRLNVSLLECPVVSHAGRLRMLMGYLRRPGAGQIQFKPYWRVLQEWSGRTIRRQIAASQRRQRRQRRKGP